MFCTGQRDPRPGLSPGPPPYTPLSTTPREAQPPMRWRGLQYIIDFPHADWWRIIEPYVAGRYVHSDQVRSIIWNPENDGALLCGVPQECTLTRDALDVVLMTGLDCEAIGAATIALICGDDGEFELASGRLDFIRPTLIPRPGETGWPALQSATQHRDKLDDFRVACLNHLGLAGILLRGIAEEDLRIAKPRNWVYPSFTGGSFFDALEAYDVCGGKLAGIVIDIQPRRTQFLPPLELFAQWGMPYSWYVHESRESAHGIRAPGHEWARVHTFFPEQTLAEWESARAALHAAPPPRQLPSVAPHLLRFEHYVLMPWKDNAGPRFESRVNKSLSAGDRSLGGLPGIYVDKEEAVKEGYFERFEFVEDFPPKTVVFKAYLDDDWVAQEKADAKARMKGKRPAPVKPMDDEDSLDEDDDWLPVMRPATGSAPLRTTARPPPPRIADGAQRAARPFPRIITPRSALFSDWRAAVLQQFPPPRASLVRSSTPTPAPVTPPPAVARSSPAAPSPTQTSPNRPPPTTGHVPPPTGASNFSWADDHELHSLPPLRSWGAPAAPHSADEGWQVVQPKRRARSPQRDHHSRRSPYARFESDHRPLRRGDTYRPRSSQTAQRMRSRSPRREEAPRGEQRGDRARSRLRDRFPRHQPAPTPSGSSQATHQPRQSPPRAGPSRLQPTRPVARPFEPKHLSFAQAARAAVPPSVPLFRSTAPTMHPRPANTPDPVTALGSRIRSPRAGEVQRAPRLSRPTRPLMSRFASPPDLTDVPIPLEHRIASGIPLEERIASPPASPNHNRRLLIPAPDSSVDTAAQSHPEPAASQQLIPAAGESAGDGDIVMADGDLLYRPYRRPIPGGANVDNLAVAWPNGTAPAAPSGSFDDAMAAVFPLEALGLPEVQSGEFAMRTGWARFQLPTVCRWRSFQHRPLPHQVSPGAFIAFAVRRGIAFDLARPGRPAQSSTDSSTSHPLPASVSFEDTVTLITSLPLHVQAQFVREGGIAWRLIQEFGAPDAFRAALEGPSSHAIRPLSSEEPWPPGVVVDRPSAHHYAMLTGRMTDGSAWWPHPDIFGAVAPTEWTAGLERWFTRRLDPEARNRGHVRSPLKDTAWFRSIQDHTKAQTRVQHRAMDARLAPALLALGGFRDESLTLEVASFGSSTGGGMHEDTEVSAVVEDIEML
ncbi:hypothetical protein PENSPDRAFT_695384 [Peniophora sp. CONT]|nr:hypothetical protein PENSPDRAFT_695384 [Peniophora sp. CONT]